MAISTNSIIHYTTSFDILCKILKEGFKIKYCQEKLSLVSTGNGSAAAHPMVSFCDIPLSDSKQHFESYGKFGIGVSKQWAFKNGVNPVLYIDENSILAQTISDILQQCRGENIDQNNKTNFLRIKSYAKNYSGTLILGEKKIKNYRFYDEREWRLVPKSEDIGENAISISLKKYLENKDLFNNKIKDYRFEFGVNDISYIIVEKTDQIPDIIAFLRNEYSNKCTAKDLDILFSKICSTEQIIADY